MKKAFPKSGKPNILLTGAAGFIGRRLSGYMDKSYNVFNVARSSAGSHVKNQIRLDLRDSGRVRQYFDKFKKKNKIYAVVHLASRMNSAQGAMDLGILYDNIRICESIAGIAKILKPSKIINFSSMAVYPDKDGLYSESSPAVMSGNADCLYGLSKFCAENILDFMLKGENILISHLRISQVYADVMRKDRIMPVMLEELKKRNTITVFGKGQRVSDFIHVEKLLPLVCLFLKKDASGIFNIGGESLSYLELAQRLIKRHGNKESVIIKMPEGRAARFRLDTRKIKRMQNG